MKINKLLSLIIVSFLTIVSDNEAQEIVSGAQVCMDFLPLGQTYVVCGDKNQIFDNIEDLSQGINDVICDYLICDCVYRNEAHNNEIVFQGMRNSTNSVCKLVLCNYDHYNKPTIVLRFDDSPLLLNKILYSNVSLKFISTNSKCIIQEGIEKI